MSDYLLSVTGPHQVGSNDTVRITANNPAHVLQGQFVFSGTTMYSAHASPGGSFNPGSAIPANNNTTFDFIFSPGSPGLNTISFTNDGGEVNPTPVTFTVTSPDFTPPVKLSADVAANGTSLTVNFTESGSPPILPASGILGFRVTVNGLPRGIASAVRSASTAVLLTLSTSVLTGDVVSLTYASGNLTDSAPIRNAVVGFTSSVTNNSTQVVEVGRPDAPMITAVAANADDEFVSQSVVTIVYPNGVAVPRYGISNLSTRNRFVVRRYAGPFMINQTTSIRACANVNDRLSHTTAKRFTRRAS